jgi:hypothetical protein
MGRNYPPTPPPPPNCVRRSVTGSTSATTVSAYRYIYPVFKYPVDMQTIRPQAIESARATESPREANS